MVLKKRTFKTGAFRNSADNKFEYYGFNHPLVETSFAQYMHHHRKFIDGTLRDSDNWWKGMPTRVIMESLLRHIQDIKLLFAGYEVTEDGTKINLEEAINGAKFNLNALQLDNLKNIKIIERNEKNKTK